MSQTGPGAGDDPNLDPNLDPALDPDDGFDDRHHEDELLAGVPHDDEPEACHFAADVEWLAAHGVTVVRATLSEQPGRFVEHDAVRFLMNVLGPAVLPVVLVDGFMRWHGSFPTRDQLAAWAGVDAELAAERAEAAVVHEQQAASEARPAVICSACASSCARCASNSACWASI